MTITYNLLENHRLFIYRCWFSSPPAPALPGGLHATGGSEKMRGRQHQENLAKWPAAHGNNPPTGPQSNAPSPSGWGPANRRAIAWCRASSSRIEHVTPNLGQSYITSTCLVSWWCVRRRRNLWEPRSALLRAWGIANKFLEPFAGSGVLGKITNSRAPHHHLFISRNVHAVLFRPRRARGVTRGRRFSILKSGRNGPRSDPLRSLCWQAKSPLIVPVLKILAVPARPALARSASRLLRLPVRQIHLPYALIAGLRALDLIWGPYFAAFLFPFFFPPGPTGRPFLRAIIGGYAMWACT